MQECPGEMQGLKLTIGLATQRNSGISDRFKECRDLNQLNESKEIQFPSHNECTKYREEEEKPCRKEKGGVGGNSTKLASQYPERLDNAYVFHLYTLLS